MVFRLLILKKGVKFLYLNFFFLDRMPQPLWCGDECVAWSMFLTKKKLFDSKLKQLSRSSLKRCFVWATSSEANRFCLKSGLKASANLYTWLVPSRLIIYTQSGNSRRRLIRSLGERGRWDLPHRASLVITVEALVSNHLGNSGNPKSGRSLFQAFS